jgi:hypothetical protein
MNLEQHIAEGEFIRCPHCRADLEVISLHPLALDWADDGYGSFDETWTGRSNHRKLTGHKGKKRERSRFPSDFPEFD